MQTTATHAGREPASAVVPNCSLDEAGLASQQARFARLAPSVDEVRREDEGVLIRFGPGFDRELLADAIAVERECCPFFEFVLDETRRTLRVAVRDAAHAQALAAIAARLGADDSRFPG